MRNLEYALGIVLAVLLIGAVPMQAQPKTFTQPKFIPRGPNEFDTAGAKKSMELAEETAGLLAREIDPTQYVVGPNDVLTVSVWTTESIHVDVVVSPEGKIVFPRAGVLDVKGLTLAQVQDLVAERAQAIYRNAKTNVSLKRLREFKVFILGAVAVPSVVSATVADRVFDILERAGGILDTGSIRGIQLFREGMTEPIIVDLQRFMTYGDERANPTVLGGDRIVVPLRNSTNIISVSGDVVQQGEYPYLLGDSLSTIIRMSGGFLPSARLDSVTVVRISEDGARLITDIYDLRSWAGMVFSNTPLENDIALRSGDRVYVRSIPRWNERQQTVIKGEVVYPGQYAIVPNQTRLTDIIAAAGGFTNKASLEDAVVFRTKEMKEVDKEYERLSKLPPSEMSTNELQYYRTKSREVKGIMSVNFADIFERNKLDNNPVLKDGDSIYIPEKNLYINVTGSVRNPGRIVYQPGRTYLDYIDLAGGFGFRADRNATLIIKVKGDQFPADSENYTLEPGDNILILDEPETRFIDVFTAALTITAQIVTIVGVVLTIVRLQ
jgi:protein involved in polysaccharide export with SLBB domain